MHIVSMNVHQQSLVALLQCHIHHHHLQMCDPLLMILLAWQHLTDAMTANLLTAHLLLS